VQRRVGGLVGADESGWVDGWVGGWVGGGWSFSLRGDEDRAFAHFLTNILKSDR